MRHTTTAFGRMETNFPAMPPTSSSGAKAAQVVSTAHTTGHSTSWAPFTTASRRGSPSSTRR